MGPVLEFKSHRNGHCVTRCLPVLWALISGTALGAGSPQPAPPFLELPVAERHLAVYDAFWNALDTNYYDPVLLAAADLRALRKRGRVRAATESSASNLYNRILAEVAAKLPESHVGAEPPAAPKDPVESPPGKYPAERVQRLLTLLAQGPGYYSAEVRRGRGLYHLVTEVMPGTPAEEAGIRPGWRVVNATSRLLFEDDSVRFMGEFIPLDPASALAWEQGELQPVQADQWHVLKITFDLRPLPTRPPIESRDVGHGIRYLRFDGFGDDAFMQPVFAALAQSDSAGLIMDLRWNGGGLTEQLRRVAGALLSEGTLLGTLQNSRGVEPMPVARAAAPYRGPLVLLIGPGSGSSAEILAAAVRDHHRGLLLGRMTNGSTLVSQVFPLPDGGIARVPIADFRTARGQRIEGVGVAPDIRVMPTLDDVRARRDPALQQAIAVLRAGVSTSD